MKDLRNFYIFWPGHPRYMDSEIIQQDPVMVVIQKIEMCLFSNQGDFIGDINFGCNLEYLLWQTTVSTDFVKSTIQQQFTTYVPELAQFNYTLSVSMMEGTLQDIMIVDITINDVGVKAVFR